jgi:hypothetical protein
MPSDAFTLLALMYMHAGLKIRMLLASKPKYINGRSNALGGEDEDEAPMLVGIARDALGSNIVLSLANTLPKFSRIPLLTFQCTLLPISSLLLQIPCKVGNILSTLKSLIGSM